MMNSTPLSMTRQNSPKTLKYKNKEKRKKKRKKEEEINSTPYPRNLPTGTQELDTVLETPIPTPQIYTSEEYIIPETHVPRPQFRIPETPDPMKIHPTGSSETQDNNSKLNTAILQIEDMEDDDILSINQITNEDRKSNENENPTKGNQNKKQ